MVQSIILSHLIAGAVAAPIHNDDGKLIGVLDFSCPIEFSHPYMLGMVTSIAHAIERECSIRVHQNELQLIHRF